MKHTKNDHGLSLTGVVVEFVDKGGHTSFTAFSKEIPEAIVEADSEEQAKSYLNIALGNILEYKRSISSKKTAVLEGVKRTDEFLLAVN